MSYDIEGSVEVRDCREAKEIFYRLYECLDRLRGKNKRGEIDLNYDCPPYFLGEREVAIVYLKGNIGEPAEVEKILKEFGPYALGVGVFRADIEGVPQQILVGVPDDVAAKKRELLVAAAREAIDKLPADERESLILSYVEVGSGKK